MRVAVFLAVAATAAFVAGPAVPERSEAERDLRGVLAVRSGRVVARENAGNLFVPASVVKLVVAAAALHHLGPDHRRETTLVVSGAPEDGELSGDLVVRAAGDPTWNDAFDREAPYAALRDLAAQVRGRGIRRVGGALVVDASLFAGPAVPPSWTAADRSLWYGAPVSALAIDENALLVRLAPGRAAGAPARVSAPAWFPIVNRTVTVGSERQGRGTVLFVPSTAGQGLVVEGEYPLGEPAYAVRASVPAPDEHAGRALLAALADAGVEVAGGVRVAAAPPPVPDETVLARHASPPLAETLERLLRVSHNWYAEMLARVLAAEVRGSGRLDVALDVEADFLKNVVGLPEGSFALADASGLSPESLFSPEAAVALLGWIHRQPWRRALLDALARPADGTLRSWGSLPPLAAKTGTMRHTVAIAGALDPEADSPTFFVVFVNHRLGDRRAARREIATLLRAWARARTDRTGP